MYRNVISYPQDNTFRDFLLCKIVNGQHGAYNASKFKIMIVSIVHGMNPNCYLFY